MVSMLENLLTVPGPSGLSSWGIHTCLVMMRILRDYASLEIKKEIETATITGKCDE